MLACNILIFPQRRLDWIVFSYRIELFSARVPIMFSAIWWSPFHERAKGLHVNTLEEAYFFKKKENTRHNGWRPLSRNKRKKKGFSWLFLHYALSIYLQDMFFSTTTFGLNAFRYWFELFSAIWCSSFHECTEGLYVNILEAEFFKNMHDATTGCHCQEEREKKKGFSPGTLRKRINLMLSCSINI